MAVEVATTNGNLLITFLVRNPNSPPNAVPSNPLTVNVEPAVEL